MQELRRIHGDPDPAWPTVVMLERAPVRPKRPEKPKRPPGRPKKVVKEPGERWCYEHHRPRKQCTPQDRHTQSMRVSDELMIQVTDLAETLGITRNTMMEMALREFVHAHGQDVAQVA